MQQLKVKLSSKFIYTSTVIQINYIFMVCYIAMPELPFMISAYYATLNSRMWATSDQNSVWQFRSKQFKYISTVILLLLPYD